MGVTQQTYRLQGARNRRRVQPPQRLKLRTPLLLTVLFALTVVFLAPFAWLVITSLKSYAEIGAYPIRWLPQNPAWSNFIQALTQIDFPHYAFNSVFLSTMYALFVTFSSSLVGFGFARLRGVGKSALFLVMLSTIMLPPILTAIPTYVMFSRVGLIDTYWPWALWGLASSPFMVFLFRQFFSSIPKELEEAAIIDGCSYWRIYWSIFLPLSGPVIATSFLLSFASVWGDWFTPSIFLSETNTTLAVAVRTGYTDERGNALINIVAAGSIIYILPVLLLFFGAQRFFIRGIVTTGLK